MFILSGITVFSTSVSYYVAMDLSTPATAVVLMYTAPIFVMIVSVLFMGEKFTGMKCFAILLTFAGCGLISGVLSGMKFNAAGFFMGILSGVLYATYNLLAKIEMRRGNNAVIATTYCFITAGIIGLFAGDMPEVSTYIAKDVATVLPLVIGIGAFTGAFPYFMYTLASKKLSASVASAMSSIEPMTAAIVSFAGIGVAREPFSISSAMGILAILVAVVLLSKTEEEA